MIWKATYMVDPGDGIVSTITFEHDSDDLVEVACDLINGDVKKEGDAITIYGWLRSMECVG